MTDIEKRWIEIEFNGIIKDLFRTLQDINMVNRFIDIIVEFAKIENPEYVTRVANAVLKLDYLNPNKKEYLALASAFGVSYKSMAIRLDRSVPYIGVAIKNLKDHPLEYYIQEPVVEDEALEVLWKFNKANHIFKKGIDIDYDSYSRDAEKLPTIRREWIKYDPLRTRSTDTDLQY